MTPNEVAKLPTGSTAGTNAKAALGLHLTKWTGTLSGAGFIAGVALRMETLALGILGLWLGYLAAYQGINMVQQKNDRDSDYGALKIKAGIPTPTVVTEKTTTTSQATSEKNTVAPAVEVPPEMGGGE